MRPALAILAVLALAGCDKQGKYLGTWVGTVELPVESTNRIRSFYPGDQAIALENSLKSARYTLELQEEGKYELTSELAPGHVHVDKGTWQLNDDASIITMRRAPMTPEEVAEAKAEGWTDSDIAAENAAQDQAFVGDGKLVVNQVSNNIELVVTFVRQ